MSVDENKALIRQFNEMAFNQRNVEARDGFLGPRFAINGKIVDPAQARRNFVGLLAAFPDFHRSMEDIIAEGDKVVARYTATGTQQGEFMGIPPTGKRVTFGWITIYRIAAGKVAEEWLVFDQLSLMRQIGAVRLRE
jgi:predicted ester cyclase